MGMHWQREQLRACVQRRAKTPGAATEEAGARGPAPGRSDRGLATAHTCCPAAAAVGRSPSAVLAGEGDSGVGRAGVPSWPAAALPAAALAAAAAAAGAALPPWAARAGAGETAAAAAAAPPTPALLSPVDAASAEVVASFQYQARAAPLRLLSMYRR
jgi:hypothetical protein